MPANEGELQTDLPDKPGPRPHRCNDRIEDFIQALFTTELQKVRPAWRQMWACIRSPIGQEPIAPYVIISDGKKYLERHERPKRKPWTPE